MGMGETARTEIADRELASTRERPASRDESHKHNTQRQLGGITRKYADKNKKGRKCSAWRGKRTGALGPGPIRGHSPQRGKELQPTEHLRIPATLHGVMG